MVEQIKKLRVEVDKIGQLAQETRSAFYDSTDIPMMSFEVAEAHKHLLLGKAWLGKLLGELGNKSPYPKDGTRKTLKDIEPTADTTKNLTIKAEGGWKELNAIEKVDYLRQEIEQLTLKTTHMFAHLSVTREFAIARTYSYNHLCEARFWLGFELARMKKIEDEK